jgi:PAS domain S-box-containing protein
LSARLPDTEIAERAPYGVAIYSPVDDGEDFSFLYLNPAGAKIAGRDRTLLIGKRLSRSFPGANELGLIEVLRRVNRSGESEYLKTAWYRDGDSAYWVDNQVSRLSTGALMTVFQDRSEQVESERADAIVRNRYWRVFENSLVGIFTVSAERVIMEINPRACEIFGFADAEAAIGRSIECVHVSYETFIRFGERVFSHLEADGVSNVRYQLKRQDGTAFWADLSGKPVNGINRADGVVWVIADITAAVEAQAALEESEERFSLAVAGANDGLWDWKIPSNEVYFSARWKQILGYREDELPDSFDEWRQRVHPQDIDAALAAIDAHLRGDSVHFQHEYRMRRKDGSWCWILARGRCIRDADGNPLRMAGSHTDIDARKRAEQRSESDRKRLQTMIETVQTGITIIDLSTMRVIEANTRAADILGLERQELIGARCSQWLCTDAEACPFQHARMPVINRESQFQHKDRRLVTVLQSVVPLQVDGRDLLLESYVDITAQKRTQEQLRAAKEDAEAAARAKSEFLAKMSHEIRTPMNSIIGMTQLTLDTELSVEQRENLEIVDASAEALLGLINDILDFSKIEAGRLDLEQVDFNLNDLVEEVLDALSLKAASKGLELAQLVGDGVPDRCRGDPARLRQILLNLVGNAVKFTDAGEVVIEIERTADDAGRDRLRFRIVDSGIGVVPTQRELIFQAFTQADNSNSRRYGGTGLGLSICRQLVQLMGGEIGLKANPGGGSIFWFTVALARPARRTETRSSEPPELEGTRCLIVDDTPANRLLLTKLLRTWHCSSTAVAGGSEALAELRRGAAAGEPYDLVLLDMMMPEMDGEQTARAIHDDDGSGHPKLIVLTSIDHRGDAARLAALDVAGYLLKPIKRTLLRKTIASVLAGATYGSNAQGASARDEPPEPDGEKLAGLHLLLVEDKLFNQRVAQGFLKRRGIEVSIASDGAQAVAKLSEGDYDAILMDVQMPVMDGYAATRMIRRLEAAQPNRRRTPIIAMTAHAMSGDRERCLDAGMDDYLTKPLDPRRLYGTLERLTGAASALSASEEVPHQTNETAASNLATDSGDPLAHLLSFFGDDPATLRDVVGIFLEDAPKSLDALDRALADHDCDALTKTAHAMKGMLRNFGLERLGTRLARIEQHARDTDLGSMSTDLAWVRHELDALTPELRERLEALSQ